jgi:hypothetical protein
MTQEGAHSPIVAHTTHTHTRYVGAHHVSHPHPHSHRRAHSLTHAHALPFTQITVPPRLDPTRSHLCFLLRLCTPPTSWPR